MKNDWTEKTRNCRLGKSNSFTVCNFGEFIFNVSPVQFLIRNTNLTKTQT